MRTTLHYLSVLLLLFSVSCGNEESEGNDQNNNQQSEEQVTEQETEEALEKVGEGGVITKIVKKSTWGDIETFSYVYDEQGRISTYSKKWEGGENGEAIYDYEYGYDDDWFGSDKVTAYLRNSGGKQFSIFMYDEGLKQDNAAQYYTEGDKLDHWDYYFGYNIYNRFSYIMRRSNEIAGRIEYDSFGNITKIGSKSYTYYEGYANNNNLDLNDILMGFKFWAFFRSELFTQFGFMNGFGKSPIKSCTTQNETITYRYKVENGHISKIYAYEEDNVTPIYTYEITYAE